MSIFEPVLAKPSQAREIQALVNRGYQYEVTRIPGSLRYPGTEEVASLIRNNSWLVLQDASPDNKIIGSLMLENDEASHHKINAFAVDPSFSGNDLGQTLLQGAEKLLVEKGVTEVFLEIISIAKRPLEDYPCFTKEQRTIDSMDDSLAGYYQKQGFAFTGNAICTPHTWQAESRKTEYVKRVYFREMRKDLSAT